MKGLIRMAVVAMVGAGFWAAAAMAADPAPGKGAAGQNARSPEQRAQLAAGVIEHILKELNLPEDKAAQVKSILETGRQAMENWRKENQEQFKELRQKAQAARQSGDKDALKALREDMAKLEASRKAVWDNIRKQLADVLTPDQLAKVEQIVQGAVQQVRQRVERLFEVLAKLDLTDDQKAKIKAIREQAIKDIQAADTPQKKRETIRAAFEKISEVLTPEQRELLKKLRQEGPPSRPAAT